MQSKSAFRFTVSVLSTHWPRLFIRANALAALTGGFYCFGCGASGGGVLDFVMARYRLDFIGAAKHVGAWKVRPIDPRQRLALERKRCAEREAQTTAERINNDIRSERHAVRDELHFLERLAHQLKHRLGELLRGHTENFRSETEFWWDLLASTHSQIRELNAAYYLLSFASSGEQENYVKHPECRKALIDRILSVGYVLDDRGRWMAVEL